MMSHAISGGGARDGARCCSRSSSLAVLAAPAFAQSPRRRRARAPAAARRTSRSRDLGQVQLLGVNGRTLLMSGLVVCVLGLVFGLVIYTQLKNLPVHAVDAARSPS